GAVLAARGVVLLTRATAPAAERAPAEEPSTVLPLPSPAEEPPTVVALPAIPAQPEPEPLALRAS
ncbi:hypothetical protein G3I40_40775, partial [Streptomyces sp. SID14478]|nr:hypothetical protein [Streptomyces sp. SID14478]